MNGSRGEKQKPWFLFVGPRMGTADELDDGHPNEVDDVNAIVKMGRKERSGLDGGRGAEEPGAERYQQQSLAELESAKEPERGGKPAQQPGEARGEWRAPTHV